MTMNVVKSGIAALALLGLSTPMAASAAPDTVEIAGVRVSFADLDINQPSGAAELYGRLKRATAVACNVESLTESGSVERLAESKACFEATLDKTVAKLASRELTRVHRS